MGFGIENRRGPDGVISQIVAACSSEPWLGLPQEIQDLLKRADAALVGGETYLLQEILGELQDRLNAYRASLGEMSNILANPRPLWPLENHDDDVQFLDW